MTYYRGESSESDSSDLGRRIAATLARVLIVMDESILRARAANDANATAQLGKIRDANVAKWQARASAVMTLGEREKWFALGETFIEAATSIAGYADENSLAIVRGSRLWILSKIAEVDKFKTQIATTISKADKTGRKWFWAIVLGGGAVLLLGRLLYTPRDS